MIPVILFGGLETFQVTHATADRTIWKPNRIESLGFDADLQQFLFNVEFSVGPRFQVDVKRVINFVHSK
jgi:hypothetical protein